MPRVLKRVDVREVSLVDKPANRRPFALVKAAGGGWKVGGKSGLPVADDSAWDAGVAEREMDAACGMNGENPDWAKYRAGHVVYDAGDPEKKGSYKLPFVRMQGGRMMASRSGLQAVRGALAGARTPIDLPPDVKAAAGRFVDRYLGTPKEAADMPVKRNANGQGTEVVIDESLEALLAEAADGETEAMVPLAKASEVAQNAARIAYRLTKAVAEEVDAEALVKAMASAAGLELKASDTPAPARRPGAKTAEDMTDAELLALVKKRGLTLAKGQTQTPVIPKDYEPLLKSDPDMREPLVALLAAAEGGDDVARASLAMHRRQAERLAKAEETAAKNEAAQRHAGYLAKAAGFRHLPASAEEVAELIEAADRSGIVLEKSEGGKPVKKSASELLVALLAKANAGLKTSALLSEIGAGPAPAGSAMEALNAAASALLEKAEGKLTREQAFVKALKAHPELRTQYEEERRAALQ